MKIKPIETKFLGCRFRSRLEARWACFFQAMGVSWVYEPEGYNLNGRWYLPDFRLDMEGWEVFAEVKPKGGFSKEVIEICRLLAVGTSTAVLLLGEIPSLPLYPPKDEDGNGSFRFITDNGRLNDTRWFHNQDPTFERAIEAARSARFEHGECG
jgi:hypothetical protein